LGRLLPSPFRKNLLQALAIEGKLGSRVLSHLFRNFEPVHGHETTAMKLVAVLDHYLSTRADSGQQSTEVAGSFRF
jgi:hypothetical protein